MNILNVLILSISDKLIFPIIKKEILESPMYSSKLYELITSICS